MAKSHNDSTPSVRHRRRSMTLNGRTYRTCSPKGKTVRELAEGMPLFMWGSDGTLTELTLQERAFLRLTRAMPADLRSELDSVLRTKGDAFMEGLARLEQKLAARRSEFKW